MAVKQQYNPVTGKAKYTAATGKAQCKLLCRDTSLKYKLTFSGVQECDCPGQSWPSDLNTSFLCTFAGSQAGYLYWEKSLGGVGDWKASIYCQISSGKTIVRAVYLSSGFWQLGFCSNLSFDTTKNSVFTLDNCCDELLCHNLSADVIGYGGMVTIE